MNFRKKSFLRIAASFTLMGVPLAVQGQERPAPKEPETNSRYVSEESENSGLVVEFHSASSWDNNILGNNARRLEDYVFEEGAQFSIWANKPERSEEHTSELQSHSDLVCRLLLEKKKKKPRRYEVC